MPLSKAFSNKWVGRKGRKDPEEYDCMQITVLDYKTTLVMVTTSIMAFFMGMFNCIFLAVINIRRY